MQTNPILRDIVLLGGGHAHALVIKKWGMNPLPGVRLTLISRDVLTPYSGMLPGLISGHYTIEDTHIDLPYLCNWAGVRFIEAEITGISPESKSVQLKGRPSIHYDVVSLDTGSTPDLASVSGAGEHTVPVKPVHRFYEHWLALLTRIRKEDRAIDIGIVGSGAGGFELLQAMHYRLQKENTNLQHRYHWIVRGETVLNGHNRRVQETAIRYCEKKSITIHRNCNVQQVKKNTLIFDDAQQLALDEIIWCTDARGPQWLAKAKLQLDDKGFLAVNDYLQSLSEPSIFAAGDISTQVANPRPKAGVFAVRAGPYLFQNLKNYALNKTLQAYQPQEQFLSLLALGDKNAIASKGAFSAHGRWIWSWKNAIDVSFMDAFHKLPDKRPMKTMPLSPELLTKDEEDLKHPEIRCAGCGAKVGGSVISKVISALAPGTDESILLGIASADDAAVFDPKTNLVAQSVDQIRAMIDDPYLFGQIAANHALSDLHAMGARAHSAMAIVSLPISSETIQERELTQVMQGITESLNRVNCRLIGGHTAESQEFSIGLAVNGLLETSQIRHKQGLRNGQKLILCKPLGTGVILAAAMQNLCKGVYQRACINAMLQSNLAAQTILVDHGASAMTDITGFGLLGHLLEMLKNDDFCPTVQLDKIPLLAGAKELSQRGIRSTLYPKNKKYAATLTTLNQPHANYELLFDPQTSGGLLAGIDEDAIEPCLAALREAGYTSACVIGEIQARRQQSDKIVLN